MPLSRLTGVQHGVVLWSLYSLASCCGQPRCLLNHGWRLATSRLYGDVVSLVVLRSNRAAENNLCRAAAAAAVAKMWIKRRRGRKERKCGDIEGADRSAGCLEKPSSGSSCKFVDVGVENKMKSRKNEIWTARLLYDACVWSPVSNTSVCREFVRQ